MGDERRAVTGCPEIDTHGAHSHTHPTRRDSLLLTLVLRTLLHTEQTIIAAPCTRMVVALWLCTFIALEAARHCRIHHLSAS